MMFGEMIQTRRLELNLTLRRFCKKIGMDSSNWSKIERGKSAPPQDEEKLKSISMALEWPVGSDEYESLVASANVAAGRIPELVMNEKSVVQVLPAFFRTVGNRKPSREELEKLVEKLMGDA